MAANRFRAFRKDDRGSVAIEYALVACIVSIAIVVGLTNTKTTLNTSLSDVGSQMKSNASN